MPQLVPTQQAVYTALPGAAQPVQQQPRQPQQPAPPPDPFRLRPGPPILVLPHEVSQQQASQQERDGIPVRMTRDDILGLWEAVKAEPHDRGRWHLLADALDEIGKPATGELMRQLAEKAKKYGPNDKIGLPRDTTSGSSLAHAATSGIPILMWPLYTRQGRHFGVYLNSSNHPWESPVATAYLSDEHGQRLLHEMETDIPRTEMALEARPIAEAKKEFPLPAHPEQFAATRAPGGTGMIIRGLMYAPGEFAPEEAVIAHPKPRTVRPQPVSSRRERLKARLRGRRG